MQNRYTHSYTFSSPKSNTFFFCQCRLFFQCELGIERPPNTALSALHIVIHVYTHMYVHIYTYSMIINNILNNYCCFFCYHKHIKKEGLTLSPTPSRNELFFQVASVLTYFTTHNNTRTQPKQQCFFLSPSLSLFCYVSPLTKGSGGCCALKNDFLVCT